jgi:hypothetical protein
VTECRCSEGVPPVGVSLAAPQRNLSLKMEEDFLEESTTWRMIFLSNQEARFLNSDSIWFS